MQPLKLHRILRGFTLRQLAARSGVEPATIIRAERGERVYPTTITKIARALDVAPSEIAEFHKQIYGSELLPERSAS